MKSDESQTNAQGQSLKKMKTKVKVKVKVKYESKSKSIDLILGGFFRHVPNFYDVRFKRANQNWFPLYIFYHVTYSHALFVYKQ